MGYWHWILISLTYLLTADGLPYGDAGVDDHNFKLSFCRFMNYSRLTYFCHTYQDNSIDEPNTFEVTKYLRGRYDQGKRTSFNNISLLFFQFQENSLCVASSKKNAETLIQVVIVLPVDGTDIQQTCFEHQSQLERNYTFSCATNIDKMKELSLTISGCDIDDGSVWATHLILYLVHNCSTVDYDNPDHDHKAIPYIPMMWVTSASIAI